MEEVKRMERQKSYICIDLKSFYASVECVERDLDPFTTNLVVADPTRSQSTICLAITPAMKKLGVKNRCRIHEIPAGIEYITAMPRMQLYIDYSAKIYSIYLRYLSKEDIHVYSIDECFMDVTDYALGGQVIHISPTSKDYINPMDINMDYSDDDNIKSYFCIFVLRRKNDEA